VRGQTLEAPRFAGTSPLLVGAFALARAAHHGPRRRGDTDIDHPVAVAALLHERGFSDQVVAAALLHDVVEDTATDHYEIRCRFGPEVGHLVAEMTEDERIEPYERRKAEHRDRIARDSRVAAIYAADKIANARAYRGAGETPPREKLDHYVETLRKLSETHPELPFLRELGEELARLAPSSRAQ
jgi:GTP diphosphokinase / guanosine-3',5'-bis(diphosphate) 3'-diphosphatase